MFLEKCNGGMLLVPDKIDYWIVAGDTPAQLEEAYAAVTETVPYDADFRLWDSGSASYDIRRRKESSYSQNIKKKAAY